MLKEDQIPLHSCLNTFDKDKQMLIADDNRRIFIQGTVNFSFILLVIINIINVK